MAKLTKAHRNSLYTARYHAFKIRMADSLEEAQSLGDSLVHRMTAELGEPIPKEFMIDSDKPAPKVEPARPNESKVVIPVNKGELWFPNAIKPAQRLRARGTYSGGYPIGAIVHFTAGRDRNLNDAMGSYKWGRGKGYAFSVIAPQGEHIQGMTLDKWGYHAGKSKDHRGRTNVSSSYHGFEVACAGRLESNGAPWFAKNSPYADHEIAHYKSHDRNIAKGKYKLYTKEQFDELVFSIIWMKHNDPTGRFSYDYVYGHDEIAGPRFYKGWRKTDPGGSLGMTMDAFRDHLKKMDKLYFKKAG